MKRTWAIMLKLLLWLLSGSAIVNTAAAGVGRLSFANPVASAAAYSINSAATIGTDSNFFDELSEYGWPCKAFRGSRNPHIIWPGFAINTIFYAAILWVIFFAPGKVRRAIRRRRGLCPACAYPVGSSPVCTECGRRLFVRLGSSSACSCKKSTAGYSAC